MTDITKLAQLRAVERVDDGALPVRPRRQGVQVRRKFGKKEFAVVFLQNVDRIRQICCLLKCIVNRLERVEEQGLFLLEFPESFGVGPDLFTGQVRFERC